MAKITHDEACDIVLDGCIEDIQEWIYRDQDSLREWLHSVLNLDDMSTKSIVREFEIYFNLENLEDEGEI